MTTIVLIVLLAAMTTALGFSVVVVWFWRRDRAILTGDLYRISQGVRDPRRAARATLERVGVVLPGADE